MNDEQLLRYSRHILLPEIGIEGQTRLRESRVLVVGAGGLGCPASLYLTAAGIGRLCIVDSDVVDLTNLQRQILYRSDVLGSAKVHAAREQLYAVNPDVELVPVASRADDALLLSLVAEADVVLDCTDNFATRHAINRACVQHRRSLVSGAAIRFDGQIAVFGLRQPQAACYACLFPEDGEAEEVACAVMGVFSPLTGVIGAMQAMEAIKLLVGTFETLAGRLLMFDAARALWRTVRFGRDPQCPVCASGN